MATLKRSNPPCGLFKFKICREIKLCTYTHTGPFLRLPPFEVVTYLEIFSVLVLFYSLCLVWSLKLPRQVSSRRCVGRNRKMNILQMSPIFLLTHLLHTYILERVIRIIEIYIKRQQTSQELRMLSSVTLNA